MGMITQGKTSEKIHLLTLVILLASSQAAQAIDLSSSVVNIRSICQIICLVYMVTGAICALVIIFFGMKYLQSGDDDEQRSNAKMAIIAVFVGMIIIICSVPLVNLVISGILPQYECDCTKAFGNSDSNQGDITISDIHVNTI